MSIQHSAIADADRHEPKGASTASNRDVLMSKGDGTTEFDAVAFSDLTGIPSTLLSAAILSSTSTSASQNPSAVNTNTDVLFGADGSTSDVSLASGVLTFTTGGPYLVQVDLNFGRDTGSTASILYVRALKNGTAYGSPVEVRLQEAVSRKRVNLTFAISATAADTLKFQMVTDSGGDGGGGLRQDTPNASGWSVVPCAKLTVSKFTNLS